MTSILEELGIRPVINGKGTSTRLGGANLAPSVLAAMTEAAACSIDAFDLQVAASQLIAGVTRAEAGMVTTGASAGLLLASAAVLARLDVRCMNRLPHDPGPRNEILVAKSHRNFYDRALLLPGARLREVGVSDRVTGAGVRDVEAWEFDDEIDDRTAAIFYVATSNAAPPFAAVTAIAQRRGVPVIVDAAAQLPPIANLHRFIELGADLIVFSGGKVIQGPPGTGILCGRRELIASAILQSIDTDIEFDFWRGDGYLVPPGAIRGLPRHGVGRSCKIGKEELVGLLAALKTFARNGVAPFGDAWQEIARDLETQLSTLACLSVQFLENSYRPGVPGVALSNATRSPAFAKALATHLRDFDPPIFLDQGQMESGILRISTICLRPQDVAVIVRAVREFNERKNDSYV